MTSYYCLIESDNTEVPHMEMLVSMTPHEAVEETRDLMRLHRRAVVAHIHQGEDRLESILA